VGLRRSREIDDLPILEGIEPAVVDLQVTQQNHDDFFAEIFGMADLATTFRRIERLGARRAGMTASQRAFAFRSASFQRSPAPMLSRSRNTSSSGQSLAPSHRLNAMAATLSLLE